MQKMVDATVEEFCRRLAEKHEGLNVEEMMGLWKETAKAPKKKDGKPKKKSAYMNFSQATRLLLRSEKPDLKFGEISTEVSRRWKALSDEEKSKYASTASAPADKAPSSPVVAILKNAVFSPPKKSKCLLKKVAAAAPPPSPVKVTPKKTMAELRKLCKERRLCHQGSQDTGGVGGRAGSRGRRFGC